MSPIQFLGLWLTILGATMLTGLAAHDGIPIKDFGMIFPPLLMMVGGLIVGLIGGRR